VTAPRPPLQRALTALAAAVVLLSALLMQPGEAGASPPAKVTLTWYGQACFLIETATGTRIVVDPLSKGLGYDLPVGLRADAVTISHEHADHNNVALVGGRPKILRGLTADKKGWTKIDDKVKDVAIRSVGVYHDDQRGAERGLNAVFIFETAGLRIAHLGDLGHTLDDQQLSAIGSVDVVLVPVGGHFTIDARQATRVLEQLHPRLVIVPMHYRTAVSTVTQLAPVDEFLTGKANVRRLESNALPITAIKSRPATEIVVMGWK
jgi:L-ascorbate metabolism protein UlaG (beta-lactamase superfamily)